MESVIDTNEPLFRYVDPSRLEIETFGVRHPPGSNKYMARVKDRIPIPVVHIPLIDLKLLESAYFDMREEAC
jgi:hypothetical protein